MHLGQPGTRDEAIYYYLVLLHPQQGKNMVGRSSTIKDAVNLPTRQNTSVFVKHPPLDLQLAIALPTLCNGLHPSVHAVTLDPRAILCFANTKRAHSVCQCCHGILCAH